MEITCTAIENTDYRFTNLGGSYRLYDAELQQVGMFISFAQMISWVRSH
jgi:hypothetical protein